VDYLLPGAMFVALFLLLFTGYPVAFVLGGVGILFGFLGIWLELFPVQRLYLAAPRIWGTIGENLVLVAVPMFIFMGTLLERSGVAQNLMELLRILLRRVRGGLALAVVLMGTVMAASTGIVGASVVMTALLALPMMLRNGYAVPISTGTIAAAGTLGIIIPPSIMLVIMAEMLTLPVGSLFLGAVAPGVLLAASYLVYLLVVFGLRPDLASHDPEAAAAVVGWGELLVLMAKGLVAPLVLIVLVLGSIFAGYATPTEAAGVGAAGALALALLNGRLSWPALVESMKSAGTTIGMIFMIFAGATIFAFVFRLLGGEHAIISAIEWMGLGAFGLLVLLLAVIFVMGFFFDWIEIALIIFPIFGPIIAAQDFGDHVGGRQLMLWFAVLVAVNLQTSYLTPPFGFALFYLRGVAPPGVRMSEIYRGVTPFVLLQLAVMIAILLFPSLALWLPEAVF
jgi:tripartite ATP-independent transporter DctM subunit